MKRYIERCAAGADLSAEEAADALGLIMTGEASDAQIAGWLIALRTKGESVDEIIGCARAMRERSVRIRLEDPDAVDIVGTGGDGLGTFNISTVAAFVIAGAGVTVAKHGNRSASGRCGSADVLAALGVRVDIPPGRVQECVNRIGIGFLFAPVFHPAMKHAARTRAELGTRTIFNLLGPLTNPAGVRRHIIGAPQRGLAEKLSAAIDRLESDRSCVVQSSEGMDEIGLGGTTRILELRPPGPPAAYDVQAADFGVSPRPAHTLVGGGPEENARIAQAVLGGEQGPHRDVVIANAAAGIYLAGKADTLRRGAELAAEAIDSGKAGAALARLRDWTAAA